MSWQNRTRFQVLGTVNWNSVSVIWALFLSQISRTRCAGWFAMSTRPWYSQDHGFFAQQPMALLVFLWSWYFYDRGIFMIVVFLWSWYFYDRGIFMVVVFLWSWYFYDRGIFMIVAFLWSWCFYDRGICKIMVFARQSIALVAFGIARSWFCGPCVCKYSRGSCFLAHLQKPQLYWFTNPQYENAAMESSLGRLRQRS